jgi:hypothetical protein
MIFSDLLKFNARVHFATSAAAPKLLQAKQFEPEGNARSLLTVAATEQKRRPRRSSLAKANARLLFKLKSAPAFTFQACSIFAAHACAAIGTTLCGCSVVIN